MDSDPIFDVEIWTIPGLISIDLEFVVLFWPLVGAFFYFMVFLDFHSLAHNNPILITNFSISLSAFLYII